LIWRPGVSHRSHRVVEESLVAIYPVCENVFRTCKVTLVLRFVFSMRTLRRVRRLVRFVAFGLVVAAVATELAKPEEERTWQGRVFGLVPYDFRPPTWQKIRDAYWNPDSDQLLSDRVFGVGWAVNLYRAKTLMEQAFSSLMRSRESLSIRMTVRSEGAGRKPEVVVTKE
jgi:hypothetical protein